MLDQEQNTPPSLMSHALKNGLILGAIAVIFLTLLYVIDYTWMVQLKFVGIAMLIYAGYVIYSGIDYRKSSGGYLSYGKAFQHGWIMLAISGLVYSVFVMLLYNVIDPELPGKLLDATMENTRAMMESFGAPADQIDSEMAKAAERTKNQFAVSGILMGYGFSLIFYAVIAAITAAIVRRNEPVSM